MAAPAPPISAPDLDFEDPRPPPAAAAPAPHAAHAAPAAPAFAPPPPAPAASTSSGDSHADLGAVIAAGFELDYGAPEPPPAAAFHRGSAIATAENAPLLIDVTPLSLRVETVGGYSDVLIAANSPVPCEKARTFLTASDGQTHVFIRVAQGESTRFAENTYLGELELSGLKAAIRGEVKILVTFELDADGILNVRAMDRDTGRETMARMKLLGASTDAAEMGEMAARQARHIVA